MDTLKIFCCYAAEDTKLMERFHAHLRGLERLDVSILYAHSALPGMEWERERDEQLRSANIILFLVSAYFINSHEHYQKEVLPAMERHSRGEARVIPIIIRPVDWQETSFGKLLPLPDGGKPVTDETWKTQDHAFFNIVSGIKRAITTEKAHLAGRQEKSNITPHPPIETTDASHNAVMQLGHIIQNFKVLRGQITSIVYLRSPKEVTLETCEKQYNRLYGDTIVFLTDYLPASISDNDEGFVEIVHRKTAQLLRKDGLFDVITVLVARTLLPRLAQLEKLGMQIDACLATLEFYKQRYFTSIV